MFSINHILEPKTLKEAILYYDENPKLKVIAGGTDVLIHLHHGKLEDVELLSLRKINHLDEVKLQEDGTIVIGAMTTFSTLFRDKIINQYISILAEASVSMGGPQIRNIATIGGNICNGAVSADSAPSLFTLNAILRLESKKGVRMIPIQDFYEGPGKVKLLQGEILTHILITEDNYHEMKGKYIKFSNRKAMDIAMLSVAVTGQVEDEVFKDLRIALGVSAPVPVRCSKAEDYAVGKECSEETIKKIGELALSNARPRNSWRGSKPYRQHLINVLTQRAIKEIVFKGGGKDDEKN